MVGYKEVNQELKNIVDYIYSIESVWNKTRDLKLQDVFYNLDEIVLQYNVTTEELQDLFYEFCETEYNNFIDWMKEDGMEDCRNYIGRTSKFHLTDIHDLKKIHVFYNLCSDVCNGFSWLDFYEDETGKIKMDKMQSDDYTESELLEFAQPEMLYITSGDFLADIKEFFADAITEADYIDNFKENQKDLFTEFLDSMLYDQADQAVQEDQADQADSAA